MTTEPERGPSESLDVREARLAIEAYLGRAHGPASGNAPSARDRAQEAAGDVPAGRENSLFDDGAAERVARQAWDAVLAVTPPPPDPAVDPGPIDGHVESAELLERRRHAERVARGLQELGYRLDETLLPGPGMAAG
ncbi:hypothetical protein ACIRP0_27435 [Streptomyces sp. NPDC101733]|uniref:hypothetical protein n=1 Tax=unclassified Streptomyces TaxID=2593676 RepID=UPI0038140F7C